MKRKKFSPFNKKDQIVCSRWMKLPQYSGDNTQETTVSLWQTNFPPSSCVPYLAWRLVLNNILAWTLRYWTWLGHVAPKYTSKDFSCFSLHLLPGSISKLKIAFSPLMSSQQSVIKLKKMLNLAVPTLHISWLQWEVWTCASGHKWPHKCVRTHGSRHCRIYGAYRIN